MAVSAWPAATTIKSRSWPASAATWNKGFTPAMDPRRPKSSAAAAAASRTWPGRRQVPAELPDALDRARQAIHDQLAAHVGSRTLNAKERMEVTRASPPSVVQFGLGTLFVAITLLAVFLGWQIDVVGRRATMIQWVQRTAATPISSLDRSPAHLKKAN